MIRTPAANLTLRTIAIFFAATVVLVIAAGCTKSGSAEASHDAVIWEAWDAVNKSYVGAKALDAELVMDGVINGMLDFAEKPAYPFLTQLDQVVDRPPKRVPEELNDLWRAWTLMGDTWPGVDSGQLSEAALRGMMESLGDPVSGYLNPEAYERSKESDSGSYEGIGAVIGLQNGQVTVISPMSGSPAERAGLMRGDVILEVNDRSVVGNSLEDATRQVKGGAGTRVTFIIQRPTENEPREINITRASIDIPTVEMSLLPGSVAYLRMLEFKDGTPDEVLDILERFNQLETLGVIIDLRNNQGGSLEVARKVAGEFLPAGPFIYQVDSQDLRQDLGIEEAGVLTDEMAMVVLVNEGTEAEAEAFAAALQGTGGATVIGATTMGLGTSNVYIELSNGSAIYIPVSNWFTPSGASLAGRGVKPDVEALLSEQDLLLGRDSQLNVAYNHLDSLLPDFR